MKRRPPSVTKEFDIQVFATALREQATKLTSSIALQTGKLDCEYTFQAFVMTQFLKRNESPSEAEQGHLPALVELAAFHLYPMFGKGGTRDPAAILSLFDALEELQNLKWICDGPSTAPSVDDLNWLLYEVRQYNASVRGSAYPNQISHRINEILCPFDAWFDQNAGVGPKKILRLLENFQQLLNENRRKSSENPAPVFEKYKSTFKGRRHSTERDSELLQELLMGVEDHPLSLAVSFEQLSSLDAKLTRLEWNALRDLIGMTPQKRKEIHEPHEIKNSPIFFLSDDKILFFDLSTVFDALFRAFDNVTRKHDRFRNKLFNPKVKSWMESQVCEYLRKAFPRDAVYQELTYSDPENPGGEAELDAAVLWEPYLILIEVKGKQFRDRSREGDPARLRDDLKSNIEEAFRQAQRAKQYIYSESKPYFHEKGTGRTLVIRKQSLLQIFPISVTLHEFAGLTTQLAQLKALGLFENSDYPWSVSIADLEIITRFSTSGSIFLHYVKRRIELQQSEKRFISDELDIFGMYLDNRLHPELIWNNRTEEGKDYSLRALTGGAERFDEWYNFRIGIRKAAPTIHLDLPPRFQEMLEELDRFHGSKGRVIVNELLNISPERANQIDKFINKARDITNCRVSVPSLSFVDENLGISILTAYGSKSNNLKKYVTNRAVIEKYRLRLSKWLGLGFNSGNSQRLLSCAVWINGTWRFDAEIEKIASSKRIRLVPGQKQPGRNDPCFCGSRKKFKKCCLDRLARHS